MLSMYATILVSRGPHRATQPSHIQANRLSDSPWAYVCGRIRQSITHTTAYVQLGIAGNLVEVATKRSVWLYISSCTTQNRTLSGNLHPSTQSRSSSTNIVSTHVQASRNILQASPTLCQCESLVFPTRTHREVPAGGDTSSCARVVAEQDRAHAKWSKVTRLRDRRGCVTSIKERGTSWPCGQLIAGKVSPRALGEAWRALWTTLMPSCPHSKILLDWEM